MTWVRCQFYFSFKENFLKNVSRSFAFPKFSFSPWVGDLWTYYLSPHCTNYLSFLAFTLGRYLCNLEHLHQCMGKLSVGFHYLASVKAQEGPSCVHCLTTIVWSKIPNCKAATKGRGELTHTLIPASKPCFLHMIFFANFEFIFAIRDPKLVEGSGEYTLERPKIGGFFFTWTPGKAERVGQSTPIQPRSWIL